MTAKSKDKYDRWRSKTIAFRVSPEEAKQLDRFVSISGLSKQDYLTRRVLHQVTVIGSSRVYKALHDQMNEVLNELKRIDAGQMIDEELMELIRLIGTVMNGMKADGNGR